MAGGDVVHDRHRTTRDLLSQFGHSPRTALAVVLFVSLGLRMFWLSMPDNALIFDESYYVNAARVMLGWEVPAGSPYAGAPAGLDPNLEHPPLGKALIALSMADLGDNGNGWRMPSVIAGMVALGALYLVVRSAGGTRWLGVLATGLLAFDNLTFVHSRLGTLDMMVVAFLLLGSWLVLSGRRLAGGAMVGFATLVKLTGVLGLVSLVAYEVVTAAWTWKSAKAHRSSTIRPAGAIVAGFLVVWLAGMWVLDLRFTTYASPLDHLAHMVSYGVSLTNSGNSSIGASIASAPWQWLFNEGQINYLRVDLTTSAGGQALTRNALVDFRGAVNPVLLGAAIIASLFVVIAAAKRRSRLALWCAIWLAGNYVPYVALVLVNHRVTYLFYILPVIPALAVAVATLLLRSGLSRAVARGYVAAYLLGFAAYFPFRQIL